MMKVILVLCLFPIALHAQLLSSKLPIVIIETTDTLPILDEPKTEAEVRIIHNENGELNFLNNNEFVFQHKVGIETRGESSQSFPKKSFLMETWDEDGEDKDTSFLNFPAEEDFILYAPFADKTLLNNALAMDIANRMGRYASRTKFVELVLNGSYEGVYVLMEKIKRDKERLDISKLKVEDISGDQLTGGYVVRIDKGDHPGWTSIYNAHTGPNRIKFQYYYPDDSELQPEQKVYIERYMDAFERAMASENLMNEEGFHYSDYINLRSFIDNFLLVELSKNVDGYRISSYFHKDRDSKDGRLTASPAWDYNLSFGNADYCAGDQIEGWIYYQCPGNSPFWWDKMLKNELFVNGLKCRWEDLRKDFLATEQLMAWIDAHSDFLMQPAIRNFTRWPILGIYVWPNPNYFVSPLSYSAVVSKMKEIISARLEWIDENIPGEAINCAFYDTLDNAPVVINSSVVDTDVELQIFPNPASFYVKIVSDITIKSVELIDVMGKHIDFQDVNLNNYTYTIPGNISPGTYILKSTIGGETLNRMLVIHP